MAVRDEYGTVYVFLPDSMEIIRIEEGTGDNLLPEDIKAGYCDYAMYYIYHMDYGIEEEDGGMLMLTEDFRDKYASSKDCVEDVLRDILDEGQDIPDYVVLDKNIMVRIKN